MNRIEQIIADCDSQRALKIRFYLFNQCDLWPIFYLVRMADSHNIQFNDNAKINKSSKKEIPNSN